MIETVECTPSRNWEDAVIKNRFNDSVKFRRRAVTFSFLATAFLISTLAFAISGSIFRDSLKLNVSYDDYNQDHATVAMDESGRQFVTWHSLEADQRVAIRAGQFFRNGRPVPGKSDFIIAKESDTDFSAPDIEFSTLGNFIITYQSGVLGHGAASVYFCIYDSNGNEIRPRTLVSSSSDARFPDVATNADGEFIIIWTQTDASGNRDHYASSYDHLGDLLSGPNKLNNLTNDGDVQGLPDIDMDSDGEVVAVWTHAGVSEPPKVVYRRFHIDDPDWAVDDEITLHQPTAPFRQRRPTVDMNDSDEIIVAWYESDDTELEEDTVYAKVYRGSAWGDTFSPYGNLQGINFRRPVGKITDDGHYLISWQGDYQNENVYVRFWRADGTPLTSIVLVTNGDDEPLKQGRPAMAMAESASTVLLVVTWEQKNDAAGTHLDIYDKIYQINK